VSRSPNDRPRDASTFGRLRRLSAGLVALALLGSGAGLPEHAQAQADPSRESRLHELKALYDKGLISKPVYLDEQRRILRDAPAAVPSAAAPSAAPPPGAGGLHAGNRWEYTILRPSGGLPSKRLFEIEQATDSAIMERIVMEDGRTLTAQHQKGAYVDMSGGMQFSPYYFAFRLAPDVGRIGGIAVKHGDPCAYGTKNPYNTYDCEVSARFEGSEVVSVPAGIFEAHLVRVEVSQIIWGFTTGQVSRPVAVGRFWFAPKAGRFVKAIVRYGGSRTEIMELVSTNVALAQ